MLLLHNELIVLIAIDPEESLQLIETIGVACSLNCKFIPFQIFIDIQNYKMHDFTSVEKII